MTDMSTQTPNPGNGRFLAHILGHLCLIGMVLAPGFQILVWLVAPGLSAQAVVAHTGLSDLNWFVWPVRLGAWAIAMPAALLTSFALWRLRRFFQCSQVGQAFSLKALSGFRAFAWSMAALVIIGPIQTMALSVFLSVNAPLEQGSLALSFGSDDIGRLFLALVFVSVAHQLERASAQKAELDSFL